MRAQRTFGGLTNRKLLRGQDQKIGNFLGVLTHFGCPCADPAAKFSHGLETERKGKRSEATNNINILILHCI